MKCNALKEIKIRNCKKIFKISFFDSLRLFGTLRWHTIMNAKLQSVCKDNNLEIIQLNSTC